MKIRAFLVWRLRVWGVLNGVMQRTARARDAGDRAEDRSIACLWVIAMWRAIEQPLQTVVTRHGDRSQSGSGRNAYGDAAAAVTLLAGSASISRAIRARAIDRLIGLPRRLTRMIVERHVRMKADCPVDELIEAILLEIENEGVLGPVS